MNGNLKIIGSNNKYTPLGLEASGELIANKLIVNSREENTPNKFVNEELNGGRVEFELTWT